MKISINIDPSHPTPITLAMQMHSQEWEEMKKANLLAEMEKCARGFLGEKPYEIEAAAKCAIGPRGVI